MAEEQLPELSTATAALEDVAEASDEKLYVNRLVDIVNERFSKAETARRQYEDNPDAPFIPPTAYLKRVAFYEIQDSQIS